jgi:NADPH:quinone reductase-like Zn-dependent oxidoreductase
MTTVPDTMMALRAHTRGGPEKLIYEQAPVPVPAPGEALVEVHAAGITFAELTWDATWLGDGGVDRTPTVPSHEVSGVVAALGPDVTGVEVGNEVYGLIPFDRDGAAAQYVCVPAAILAAKPVSISHTAAAAVPLAALTAWQALTDRVQLHRGERVLVQGGAGGVGTFTVQLAALAGAQVTATCRAADTAFVAGLGAEHVIDIDTSDFAADQVTYDVVVDTVGGATLDRSFTVLRRGGRLVSVAAPPSAELADKFGVRGFFFIVTSDRDALGRLAALLDGGQLRVTVAATYPLERGREAFESGSSAGRRPGKTVLVVR